MPFVRTYASVAAGVGQMPYRHFVILNAIGVVLWAGGVTLLGYALGNIAFIADNIEALLVLVVLSRSLPIVVEVLRKRRAARGRSASTRRSRRPLRRARRAGRGREEGVRRMTHHGPREIRSWLSDMDGVLVHEGTALPGAAEFVRALRDGGRPFLVLTNNSIFTPRDLRARLATSGIDLPEDAIWTSALATAQFLTDQMPSGSAYVIGEAGLTTALYEAGYTLTAPQPDFVVLGETRTYSFEAITQAVRLIQGGARFIATNPDVTGPSRDGDLPATGAVAAMIRAATGRHPYFVGKPNPMMIRTRSTASTRTPRRPRWSATGWTPTWSQASRPACARSWCCPGRRGCADVERFPFRPSEICRLDPGPRRPDLSMWRQDGRAVRRTVQKLRAPWRTWGSSASKYSARSSRPSRRRCSTGLLDLGVQVADDRVVVAARLRCGPRCWSAPAGAPEVLAGPQVGVGLGDRHEAAEAWVS